MPRHWGSLGIPRSGDSLLSARPAVFTYDLFCHYILLRQGQDLARNICVNPGALVDVNVENCCVIRYVDISELAVELGIGP